MNSSLSIRSGKRGTTIRARGSAAQQIIDGLANSLGEPATFIAYCWASGHIDFGSKVPDGAIEIARGQERAVRELVAVTARHGYRTERDGQRVTFFLVPGVPESNSQRSAGDALGAYLLWIKDRETDDLTISLGEDSNYNPFYSGSFQGKSYFTLDAADRVRMVANFNRYQCRAACKLSGLQRTVRTALERRLRKLERTLDRLS